MSLPPTFLERVASLALNRTEGAHELASQAARILRDLQEEPALDLEMLTQAARAVVAAQPAMAPLFTLANQILLGDDPVANLVPVCRRFIHGLGGAAQTASSSAAQLILRGSVVMTHSFSMTVRNAIYWARAEGKEFEVLCTEARPLCEGAELARELGQEGVPVTLVVDAAIRAVMPRVNLVLVGADAITACGVINKTGTALLAAAAAELSVPMYALCTSEKLVPAGYSMPEQEDRDPAEVLPDAAGVKVVNRYFESTPLEAFRAVLTERGALAPAQLREMLNGMPVHPGLAR